MGLTVVQSAHQQPAGPSSAALTLASSTDITSPLHRHDRSASTPGAYTPSAPRCQTSSSRSAPVVFHHLDGLLRTAVSGVLQPVPVVRFAAFQPRNRSPHDLPATRCTPRRIPLVGSRSTSLWPLPSCRYRSAATPLPGCRCPPTAASRCSWPGTPAAGPAARPRSPEGLLTGASIAWLRVPRPCPVPPDSLRSVH
jgi:hypothetical protein